jgi:hypothetical protein
MVVNKDDEKSVVKEENIEKNQGATSQEQPPYDEMFPTVAVNPLLFAGGAFLLCVVLWALGGVCLSFLSHHQFIS